MIQLYYKNYFSYTCTIAICVMAILAAAQVMDPNWCGNKHKNLVRLQDILRGDPDAEVPPFLGISTGRVEDFLRKENPEIFRMYRDVTERLNSSQSILKNPLGALRQFVRGITYRRYRTEDLLQLIQQEIKNTFTKPFPFTQDERRFFQTIAQQNGFLMVRSTGVEDNPNVANAGGNVSVAYVSPSISDIEKAMGEVVASYFGMQSLKNRIAGGEILSAEEHTIPVLIQALVGEPLGGTQAEADIPVSGVAYTTNPNLSDSTFSITEIDAAYGHGEGVVANRVTADRYFIKRSHVDPNSISIYPMLYEKNVRLIPAADRSGLIEARNSNRLTHKSALSQEQLTKLYRVLKKIEAAYGEPTDVEFIVTNRKIYIVQARPAMNRPAQPSYIDLDRITTIPTTCITLVPGTGSLQIITDPKDIIVTRTLDEADQMPNSFSAKAVIVSTWASSLSHAAVNFMSHGTPCVYIQNLSVVQNELNSISAATPLIIDTQRGILFFWKNIPQRPQNFIVQGWFEHPIDRTLSLFIDNAPIIEQSIAALPKDSALMRLAQSLKLSTDKAQQKTLLTAINERVEKLLDLTERRIKTTNFALTAHEQQALSIFKSTYHHLIAEFFAAIDKGVDHFEFLFYHKMLEALLYQLADTQKVLAGYTYSYFLNEIFTQQYIQRIARTRQITHVKELNFARLCPTQELANKWIDFITKLDNLIPQQSADFAKKVLTFESLINDLDQSGNLSLWLATSFYQVTHNNQLSDQVVKQFVEDATQQYTPQAEQFLKNLTLYHQQITSFKSQRAHGFATAAAAETKWRSIQQKLIDPMTSPQFIADFHQAPFAMKMIACNIMHECIDVLDSTIKELKTSIAIPLNNRISMFKGMLNDFYNLFKKWIREIMPENALVYQAPTLTSPFHWTLTNYLNKMDELFPQILSQSNDASMFQRSASFAVNAAMLGSRTAFQRHYPVTAEDLFMLVHQNALVAVAGTVKSLFSSRPLAELLSIPPLLETYRKTLESNLKIRVEPIGISYTSNEIKIYYNIPLNNHSATLQLIYNTITQEYSCAFQILGNARGDRWDQLVLLARISPELSGLSFAEEIQFEPQAGIVSWSWIIERENQLQSIIDYVDIMCNRISFSTWGGQRVNLRLNINDVFRVYTKTTPRAATIKKILEDYQQRFGRSAIAQGLIQEIR